MGHRESGAARSRFAILIAVVLLSGCGGGTVEIPRNRFQFAGDAEAVARVTVDCAACDWSKPGSEAVVLVLTIDDRPLAHIPVVRSGKAEYRVMLGTVPQGRHKVVVAEEPALTAESLRGKGAATWSLDIEQVPADAADKEALSLAPFVYARPDTIGKFNDVPLLMWYEIEPTDRGKRYRYSVIFSNEDGGTPTDRLMATWGRTTDIEYIYSVEVDAKGAILSEDLQGPDHEILPYKGQREGKHPMLWVSTHNNMVLDHGTTTVRYAPEPVFADLSETSRETVMDENPWTYAVMAKELAREGKIVADAPTGGGTIPDPRRFVFLQGCGQAGNNALALAVKVKGEWFSSDRGVTDYRVVRDGCFRVAVPLPSGTSARDVESIRAQAFTRQNRPRNTPSRIISLSTRFMLDDRFAPAADAVRSWAGNEILKPDGPPFETKVQ